MDPGGGAPPAAVVGEGAIIGAVHEGIEPHHHFMGRNQRSRAGHSAWRPWLLAYSDRGARGQR
jgi:hypothetical protein